MRRLAVAAAIAAAALLPGLAAAQAPIRIGYISSFTGPEAGTSKDMGDGFKLAIKLMDSRMGRRKVEVIYGDDQLKPDIARQLADKMVQSDGVQIIAGINLSNMMLAIAKPVLDSGIFLISANAGPSQMAGKNCHPHFFAVSHQNDTLFESVGLMMEARHVPSAYIVAPNYPAGRDMLNGFKRNYHGQVVGETYTSLDQLDYAGLLADIRAKQPAAVMVFLPGSLGINFGRQYAQSGLKDTIPLYTGPGMADQTTLPALGDAALGIDVSTNWSEGLDNKASRDFVAAFEQEYGRLPSPFAAVSYDTARVIATALASIDGRIEDKAAFRRAMENVKPDSVRGAFAFNTNHFPIQNMYRTVIGHDAKGRVAGILQDTIVTGIKDIYAADCHMPPEG
jgi:branched-chain amino acid transport system substrate-binding protein